MHAYRDQYASLFRGGRDIVLIGISTDAPEALQSWAEDDEFPFLFASDPGSNVGQQFGAFRETRDGGLIDNRTLFVIDPEGRIAWRAVPFREVDPTAYVELGDALDRIAPVLDEAGME
jgi:peroxiredoxin